MTPSAFLDDLRGALASGGINHVGVVSRARYDAAAPPHLSAGLLHPPTRSVVVAASGGGALWSAMLAHVAGDPRHRLARTGHPLDDFTKHVVRRCGALLDGCRVIHPHLDDPVLLPFMRLGELAGLGRASEIGILVSSRFGPWLGLRAAIFTPHELPGSPADRRSCDGCPAPCRAACPGGVVGPWEFSWERCVAFRNAPESPCTTRCAAREACVVAPQEMYPEDERLYHMDRAAGRAALCRRFGVADEVGA